MTPQPTQPYVISGQVNHADGSTGKYNVQVTITNGTTSDSEVFYTKSSGKWLFDCRAYTNGYSNGDVLTIATKDDTTPASTDYNLSSEIDLGTPDRNAVTSKKMPKAVEFTMDLDASANQGENNTIKEAGLFCDATMGYEDLLYNRFLHYSIAKTTSLVVRYTVKLLLNNGL